MGYKNQKNDHDCCGLSLTAKKNRIEFYRKELQKMRYGSL
jgi:hypothetical protein